MTSTDLQRRAGAQVTAPGFQAAGREMAPHGQVRLGMVSWMVAGIKTHYLNVRQVAETTPALALRRYEVDPYITGGGIERLPLPNRFKANLRSQLTTLPLLGPRPLDVVWTQTLNSTMPFIFTRAAFGRMPVVYDIDTTPRLLASFGRYYAEQVTGPSLKRWTVDTLHRAALRRVALVVTWSEWAARSFRDDYGVPDERIRIIPPGAHLAEWAAPAGEAASGWARGEAGALPRLLFVGADFERKGGDLLLDVYRRSLRGRCELHLVTKAALPAGDGVFVYRDFSPNDPALRRLYQRCDALVLPTRADCFSLAAIEAMAAGLPVIITATGGAPEIVRDGETGYVLAPDDGQALLGAIEALLADPTRARAFGAAGLARAAARFDAAVNARRLLDATCALARA